MAKRKRRINPHECGDVIFSVIREEVIDEFGQVMRAVIIKCEDCGETGYGATLKGAIAAWNDERPLPKRRAKRIA